MKVAYDLREVLFQGRGWQRYGVSVLRELVKLDGIKFLFVVEDAERARNEYDFLSLPGAEFLELELDRSLDSTPAYHPAVDSCDIFHSLTEFPEFITQRAQLVVSVHDTSFRICPEHTTSQFARAAAKALAWNASHARVIFVMTRWVEQNIRNFCRDEGELLKAQLVHTSFGVDHLPGDADFSSAERVGCPFILYVGGIEPDKNLDLLLTAFRALGDHYKELRLVVVSTNAHTLRAKLNADDGQNIVLLSDVDDRQLAGLYLNCRVHVSTALDEGLGLCPLEAASLGATNVLSDIPVFRETLGGQASFFNPHCADELVRILTGHLEAQEDPGRLESERRKLVSAFKWGVTARRLLDCYRELVI